LPVRVFGKEKEEPLVDLFFFSCSFFPRISSHFSSGCTSLFTRNSSAAKQNRYPILLVPLKRNSSPRLSLFDATAAASRCPIPQADSASTDVAVVAIDPLLDRVFEDVDADWFLLLFEQMFLIIG